MKLVSVIVLSLFSLAGQTYRPGPAQVPENEVEGLRKRGLIAGEAEDEGEESSPQPSTREIELVTMLAPLAQEGETPVQTLQRIVEERDTFKEQAREAQEQLSGIVTSTQEQLNALESQDANSELPLSIEQLTEATNGRAAVALALLDAGFGTKEKLRAATNDELDAIEGVGENTIAKLRELAK